MLGDYEFWHITWKKFKGKGDIGTGFRKMSIHLFISCTFQKDLKCPVGVDSGGVEYHFGHRKCQSTDM